MQKFVISGFEPMLLYSPAICSYSLSSYASHFLFYSTTWINCSSINQESCYWILNLEKFISCFLGFFLCLNLGSWENSVLSGVFFFYLESWESHLYFVLFFYLEIWEICVFLFCFLVFFLSWKISLIGFLRKKLNWYSRMLF